MTRTKTQVILRYLLYGVVGIALVAVASYFLVIRPLQIRNEKANFAKAETQLDALAAQIEKIVGKPDNQKKEKSCERPNLKSEKGPLGCDITIYLLYENKDSKSATQVMKQVSSLSSAKLRIGSGAAKGMEFIAKDTQRGEQTLYQDFSSNTTLECAFSYTYPATDHELFSPSSQENIQIGLGCGGTTITEVFPNQKNNL